MTMPSLSPSTPLLATPAPTRWSRLAAELTGGTRARWLLVAFLLCAIVPAFFSWPEFPLPPDIRRAWIEHWDQVVQFKVDDPAHDYTQEYPDGKNEAKRNFRIAVPLLAYLTHSGMTGVHVARFTLQAVLIICVLLAAERAAGDRLVALAAALAIAGTYTGTSVWRDVCRWFDNCTHAFLALALILRPPWLAGGAVVLAAFTDERALLIVPLLILFHWFTGSPRRTLIGLAAGIPGYVAIRLAFALAFHLRMPTTGIAEWDIFFINTDNVVTGYWFALEGGWLLVAIAIWRGWASGRSRAGLALALATALPVVAAMGVGDFTRSAAYAFPAVLAALALLRRSDLIAPAELRTLAVVAAAVSLLTPNVFVMRNVFHESSVPVRLLLGWLQTKMA
jgi:hypothetical protein